MTEWMNVCFHTSILYFNVRYCLYTVLWCKPFQPDGECLTECTDGMVCKNIFIGLFYLCTSHTLCCLQVGNFWIPLGYVASEPQLSFTALNLSLSLWARSALCNAFTSTPCSLSSTASDGSAGEAGERENKGVVGKERSITDIYLYL